MRNRKFLGLGAAAAAVAGLAVAIVPAASASADAGALTLCSEGGNASYAAFPDRGGFSTFVIPNGQCYTTYLGGNTNEDVDVYNAETNQYIASTLSFIKLVRTRRVT